MVSSSSPHTGQFFPHENNLAKSALAAAHALMSPGLVPWGEASTVLWRSMEMNQRLQQQWMERMRLRGKELAVHGLGPWSPNEVWNLTLASMRWSLQEWEQATQDLMSAALTLRGDCRMDGCATAAQPDLAWEPYWGRFQQQMTRQSQAWMKFMGRAAMQRSR